jgi:hypothetical protein
MNSFTERNSKLAKFRNLHIERTPTPRPKPHRKRILVIAISAAIIVAIAALTFGLLAKTVPVMKTAPAVPVTSVSPGTTLSATGYIVAHHKIDETQRFRPVKSMAVEKGHHLKAGQVLVELEDDETQLDEAPGQVEAPNATSFFICHFAGCQSHSKRAVYHRASPFQLKQPPTPPTICLSY